MMWQTLYPAEDRLNDLPPLSQRAERTETKMKISCLLSRWRVPVLALFPAFLSLQGAALAQTRGYTARACGLDLNHNGIPGEAADCGVLCSSGPSGSDGNVTISGSTYTQVYVDCVNGNNSNAGTRTSPKKSITSALTVTPTTGASLAVCFSGTCTATTGETFPIQARSGLAATFSRAASGNEHRAFEYPSKPAIIMGWDRNAPFGDYPPHDPNDIAVIDGTHNQPRTMTNTACASYSEFAHFTLTNFDDVGQNPGFTTLGFGGCTTTHLWWHDLEMDSFNKGGAAGGGDIVFNWSAGNSSQWAAAENLNIMDVGGYVFRGSCDPPCANSGPFRFKNISVRGSACTQGSGSSCTVIGFKIWGMDTGFEVVDNDFNYNPAGWSACASSCGGSNVGIAVEPAQCTQDWWIVHNRFTDFPIALQAQPYASGFCTARNIDRLVIDRNEFANAYNYDGGFNMGLDFEAGGSGNPSIGNVTVTNNMLSSRNANGWQRCMIFDLGATASGTVNVVGNTCAGNVITTNQTPAMFQTTSNATTHTFNVQDNIFSGTVSYAEMCFAAAPSATTLNGNVYAYGGTGASKYAWATGTCGSGRTNLATWKTNSGDGSASKECAPSFVNASGGDYHLSASDVCARDAGVGQSAVTTVDFDGQARPSGSAWDIGADEFSPPGTPTPTPPPPPVLTQVIPLLTPTP